MRDLDGRWSRAAGRGRGDCYVMNREDARGEVPGAMSVIRLDATAPSSTGLHASVAAALAYLAGPFSGAVILAAERTNAFVRFHAWQSIIGLGGLGAAIVALLFLAFVALLVFSPTLFTWLYRLAGVATVAWLVAWAFCLVKAFSGSAWKLPYAGQAAIRRVVNRSGKW